MNIKKKYLSVLILVILSLTLVSCTGDKGGKEADLYDDVEDVGDIKDDAGKNGDKDVDKKGDVLKFSSGSSIYVDQLEGRVKQAFLELRKAALTGTEEVILETVVTHKDLRRIMNILLLDSPEAIGLSNNYSYKADNAGNVSTVKLKYFLTPDVIQELSHDRLEMEKKIQSSYTDEKTLKKDVALDIVRGKTYTGGFDGSEMLDVRQDTPKSMLDYSEGKEEENITYNDIRSEYIKNMHRINKQSIRGVDDIVEIEGIDYDSIKAFVHSDATGIENLPLVKLKGKVGVLRSLGFNASIVAGEFVGYDFIPQKDPLGVFDFMEASKLYKEEDGENGFKNVSLDPYNYYFWMVIDIDGDYYIHDIELADMVNYKIMYNLQDLSFMGVKPKDAPSYYSASKGEVLEKGFYELVPDYLLSGSRIMYYNEDILGVPPAATKDTLSNIHDSEHFIPTTSLSDLKTEANNFADHIVKTSSSGDVEIRVFKDAKSMEEFATFFTEGFEAVNESSKYAIKEHDVLRVPILNMFIVYNIVS